MPARRPLTEESTAEVKAVLKNSRSKDEFRRALCVWLREGLGMTVDQVAAAVGWSPAYVRLVKSKYLRKGASALEGPGRGGRRRNVLSEADERKLLRRLRDDSWPNSVVDFRMIHQAVEKQAGRHVNPSIVQRMLSRHGWARGAWVAIPKHYPSASVTARLFPSSPSGQADEAASAPGQQPHQPSEPEKPHQADKARRARRSGVWYPLRDAAEGGPGEGNQEKAGSPESPEGPHDEGPSQGASPTELTGWGRWLRDLREADGPQVPEFVRRHWRTDKIVVHGQVFSPAELAGVGAFEANTLVGLVTYNLEGEDLEIVTLASDRPGKGLGSQLLASAVELSRQARLRRLWLITTNDNLNALRFYQKRGFSLVAVHRGAVEKSRRIKPEISLVGEHGIPIRDEVELELMLTVKGDK